ncbi:ABC transporter C member 13 [Coemansia sp. Benny D160-2]|nr:ABC transporter C member 13 [Coemansia sp. Benny D160-2]
MLSYFKEIIAQIHAFKDVAFYPASDIALFLTTARLLCRGSSKGAVYRSSNPLGQCCYAMLLILATIQCQSWTEAHLPLSIVSLILLATQPGGYYLFQVANLSGMYRSLSGHIGTDIWYRLFYASMHFYLLLANLDKQSQEILDDLKDMLLFTQERRLLSIQKTRNVKLEDLEEIPEHNRLSSVAREFKYNINEPLFVLRAIFRLIWRPMIPIYIIDSLLSIASVGTSPANNEDPASCAGASVALEDCDFVRRSKVPVLRDISFNVKDGELVAVVGKTGSGKSSLLLSICGEIEKTKGSGAVHGSVTLMEQLPWIMNDTVRENILFGRAFDRDRYNRVVEACALTSDINVWTNGDKTMIGERGINISGGQRARLALARTVYSEADIYVLDDPLSAVDAHVKRHILDNVIMDPGLLGGKIRVVAVNDEKLLPYFHQVVRLDGGKALVTQQEPQEYLAAAKKLLAGKDDANFSDAASDVSSTVAADSLPTSPAIDVGIGNSHKDNNPAKPENGSKLDKMPETHKRSITGVNTINIVLDSSNAHHDANTKSMPKIREWDKWDNMRYVLDICGITTLAVMGLSGFVKPIFGFIIDGYKLSFLKSNRHGGDASNDAILRYMRMTMLETIVALNELSRLASIAWNLFSGSMFKVCILAQNHLLGHNVSSGGLVTFSHLAQTLISNVTRVTELPSRLLSFNEGIDLFRHYLDMDRDDDSVTDAVKPPADWPSAGKIEFRNFSVKYRSDLEYALKDINLTINPGEKIGIVGRTGAGKSSLSRAVFRLISKDTCEGAILIDDCDISSIHISDLRPKIGTIPQEPTLFSGSFKKNLDPLLDYSIEDMWAALVKCNITEFVEPKRDMSKQGSSRQDDYNNKYEEQIKEEIADWDRMWKESGWIVRIFLLLFVEKPKLEPRINRNVKHGLDKQVGHHGRLSAGQKQLFSLCRLLMRRRKIIVLDEATAEVDLETDKEMQKLFRGEFKDCTVLTIAHRLETIMNSDKIIVMDEGSIAEFGPPKELIERGGMFAELVKANEF